MSIWKPLPNIEATKNNPIVQGMYFLTFPVVLGARSLGVSPNLVTATSVGSALVAFVSLSMGSILWFASFWVISLLLDFVDGQLARLTKNVSSFPLNLDHFSDLLKIGLILVGFGVFFRTELIWILCSLSVLSFLYFSILNQACSPLRLGILRPILRTEEMHSVEGLPLQVGVRYTLRRATLRVGSILYTLVFSFNAHTLLLFLVVPIGEVVAAYILGYVLFLGVWNSSVLVFKVWLTTQVGRAIPRSKAPDLQRPGSSSLQHTKSTASQVGKGFSV